MNGGSRIIEWRHEPPADEGGALPGDRPHDDPAIDAPPRAGVARLVSLVALLLALGWIGAMGWLARASLPGMPPVALAQFVAALCVPPALLGILLLLGLRTGAAEARRFGRTAQAMRAEAASLERSVGVISRTIDANRIKLAEQTTALMAIGDGAAAGLAAVSAGMTEQVGLADQQARRLAAAADDAQDSLGLLLALLPRAHGETGDLARLIETAGVSASEHAAALDAQLVALGERGREADIVAGGAAQRLAAHITRMDATVETAGARLETMTGSMSSAVDGLLARTADAVDGTRRGIAAQGEAMLAMLGTNQAALERAGQDGAEALAGRMSSIEALIDRIVARLDHQRVLGDAMVDELDHGIARVSGNLDALHAQGIDRSRALAASIGALGSSAEAMTEALKAGDAAAGSAIETTDRLLVALDSTAREIDETLPAAIARLDAGIAGSRRAVAEAGPELISLVGAAEGTHDAIEVIAQIVAGQRETLDRIAGGLIDSLASGRSKVDALGQIVDDTISRTNRFAEDAAPRLVEALLRVRDTASAAADRARETLATVIPEAAQALETASAAAMRRGAGDAVERQVAALGQAAEAAADAASRASDRLTRQMAALAEATALVDARIQDARAERENPDRDTFSRRVSLLIESLNSASIDIAKSFSTDVSDSAWAAYLKGDRGVFTRRAVRLIEAGEAREIARFYNDDSGFREQVNRYIHDFEAMLRVILAQRDGSPLGVTLLSSDMGKLYVALAQAIERLRN